MNNIDRNYKELLSHILKFGTKKADRTGTGTISTFGWQIRHKMSEGFPLLTTRKMSFKTMVTELLWFLKGDTNIKYLLDNNCHIWTGDAFKRYTKHCSGNSSEWNPYMRDNNDGTLSMFTKDEFTEQIKTNEKFAKVWGDLGPIYGKQWRKWRNEELEDSGGGLFSPDILVDYPIDQIAELIEALKTNPDSRRLMVTAWNPAEIEDAVLPPCHYGFQMYTRELTYKERYRIWFNNCYQTGFEYNDQDVVDFTDPYWIPTPTRAISLMWNQRSVDTPLGLATNIPSYALLLLIIAKKVGMWPDELIGNLGDCHIYLNQVDGVNEQLERQPFDLPYVEISDKEVNDISEYTLEDFTLHHYQSHGRIAYPLSN